MVVSKRLTKTNSITIPKALRLDAGFMPYMAVDIEVVPDGVLIKKHVPVCRFCGTPINVKTVNDMDICAECGEKLKKDLEVAFNGNV